MEPRFKAGAARRAGITLAVLVATACAACSPVQQAAGPAAPPAADTFGTPADPAAVQRGGTLTMALSAEPDMLDPTQSRSLYSRYVFSTMCEKLYDLDENAAIVPQLASALPQTSPDGLTVTIPVREGIRFADGTPMDASAVAASLDRHLNFPGSGRKSELGPITAIEASGPSTVTVRFSAPFGPFTSALADRAGMIMSPDAVARLGEDFGIAPVCVGPFKFQNRVAQNSIEVVRDPNYYAADTVFLDAITYRIITDDGIRAANLRSGDALVADSLSPQDVPGLRDTPGITVLESPSLGYQGVTFNIGNVSGIDNPPGRRDSALSNDPRIRQAFELSLDREGLVRTVFAGLYSAACSPISPATEFTSEAAQACTPHDPAAAKKLLEEAGVPIPFHVSMITTNTPDFLRLAQAMQANLAEGGFALEIQPVEYSALLDQQDRGDYEVLQLGWSGRIDPHNNIANFLGTGGGQNVAGYSDPALDALLEQARTATDQAERVRLYGEAVTAIQAADPLIYLYRERNLTGHRDGVAGVQTFPDGVVRLAFAALTR